MREGRAGDKLKVMRSLAVVTAVVMVCGWATAPAQKAASTHVGVMTRVFRPKEPVRNWRGEPDHALHCIIWYPAPATAVETPQVVGPPDTPLFEAGMAAPDAPLAPAGKKGFPLVLLSHGTGGSAIQMAWLGTALARAGFIAVAVDHPGNTSNGTMTPEGMALWWERATDLSQVLDSVLADSTFGKQIDQRRIGAAGYSLGGYTVLELAGAQTDVGEFFRACKADADLAVCHIPEARGMGEPAEILQKVRQTSGESLARSGELYSDDRIGAVFAIAPALGFTLTQDSLRAIRMPVEMVVGDADNIAPAPDNAQLIRGDLHGARLTLLPHVGHYTFLDTCTAAGKKTFDRYCTDDPGVNRNSIHEKVAGLAVDFFKRSLH
jgi:predicted dienelactone hydrolase